VNNQRVFIGFIYRQTKGTFVIGRLLPVLDVDQSVRRPKMLERVRDARQVSRRLDLL
jgi:hypothetical protein